MATKKDTGTKATTSSSGSAKKQTVQLEKSEFDALMARLSALEEAQGNASQNTSSDDEIRNSEYIRVMSMLSWPLNLSTGEKGRRPYTFNGMYETKRILYSDLVRILDMHQSFAEYGYFYVLDERVIKLHGLEPAYDKILDKEKLETILSGSDANTAIDVFKIANKRQQIVIANILISKLRNKENVDKNLVYAVSEETGIDIFEKSKEEDFLPKKND